MAVYITCLFLNFILAGRINLNLNLFLTLSHTPHIPHGPHKFLFVEFIWKILYG
jgi:hypothetical protein